MGLLDDYQVDLNEAPDGPDYDIADDFYQFVLGDMFRREGTDNYPDRVWIVIDFSVGDEGKSFQEWFLLPEDPDNRTVKEDQTLGRLKTRLRSLGADDEDLKDIDPDRYIGLTGSFELVTRKNKNTGKEFQNIRNLVLEDEAEAEPEEAAPAPAKRATPVRKATPTAAARSEAAAPAKAAAKGAVNNPFGKKPVRA
jgi:hypothetical protein